MKTYDIFKELEQKISRYDDWNEETITDYFLSLLADSSHRIKYRKFTKYAESLNGADWEWWLLTDFALIKFYVQAKKIYDRLTVRTISYKTKNSSLLQLEKLMEASRQDNALPLYAFYSGCPLPTICKYAQNEDYYKAIYLASAIELQKNMDRLDDVPLLNPMSCFYKNTPCGAQGQFMCIGCTGCEYRTACTFNGPDNADGEGCSLKLIRLLQTVYFQNMEEGTGTYETLPEHIILFQYANSLFNNKLISKRFFDEYSYALRVKNIVITDYTSRHGKPHLDMIIGTDNVKLDLQNILDVRELTDSLGKLLKKYRVIGAIGLFGSYARGEAHAGSDLDIMLKYNPKEIIANGFQPILAFLKEVIMTFHKPVDFVDYEDCDTQFREEVEDDIIWINDEL
nr:nucleotidyltransferase domain-containing protein [uncultured Eisenbergiella sp.]